MQLGDSEAQLIAESIPHIVWLADRDGRTTYFNKRGTDYTGFPPEANYDWDWVGLVHPEDAERARRGWERAARTGCEYALEYRIRRHDGAFRWHASRGLPLRDASGEIYLWIGTATDIEDQKQLELSLRHAEREAVEGASLLTSIERSAPVGVALTDREFRLLRINPYLTRFCELPPEAQLGKTVAEVVPQLWSQIRDAYERARAGETVPDIEVTTEDPDNPGRSTYWLASYYPVEMGGEIIGVGNVVFDITLRKTAELALAKNLDALVQTIARTVEFRDPYTAGHQQRVADLAAAAATEMGLDPFEVEGIRTAASIHDIGKISIPAEILSKPSKLLAAEMELIRQHSETGYAIVQGIDFPWPVAEMIRQHHERQDGSGYPRGIAGDEILLGSRIIAVADVIEAMVSHRPYRPGYSLEEVLTFVTDQAAMSLDPDAVGACVRLLRSGALRLQPWSG